MPGRAPHSANSILPGYRAAPSIVQAGDKGPCTYAAPDPWVKGADTSLSE